MRRYALAAALATCLAPGMFLGVRAASFSGLWTTLPAVPSAHQHHTATLLLDGKILVAGGMPTPRAPTGAAELYRPETNDWLPVQPMLLPRGRHGAALLTATGKVLVAGGQMPYVVNEFGSDPSPFCGPMRLPDTTLIAELFDPSTLSWTLAPGMHQARAAFDLVRLL